MKINVRLEKNVIVGYKIYPFNFEDEYIELDTIPEDILSGNYSVNDHKLCLISSNSLKQEEKVNVEYNKKALEDAFKQYRADAVYGIIIEDEEQHERILSWYKNLQANLPESFCTVSNEIIRYLEV